jgi:ABC-type multidrug transport system fused ATPase/permease subunit
VLGRALRYAAPFRGRFAAKLALLLLGLVPLLVLPWPVKIVVDHVVLGIPVGEQPTPYPVLLAPLVDLLRGRTPGEILAFVVAAQLLFVVVFGAAGAGGGERDQTDAWLASGHDEATRTENEANAGFSMTGGLVGLADFLLTLRLTQALNHHYRARLFERIQRLPFPLLDDERIGDAIYRVLYDTPSITSVSYRILLTPAASLCFAVAVAFTLQSVYGQHPLLLGAALGLLLTALLATLPFAGALRRAGLRSRRAGAAATTTLEEGLSNVLAVQSLGGEERELSRFDAGSRASFRRHRSLLAAGMAAFLAALLPGAAIAAVVFLHVSDLVIAGRLSLGDWSLLFAYFLMLAFACVELGALWIRLQTAAAGLSRVFFLMDLAGEADPPGARELPRVRESVRVEDVHYAHPDGTHALRGVSLEARTGRITALVGPAGAGKTTLAGLVPRFVAPQRGRVLFDGADVTAASLGSVRRQVAFVFQETVLFDASLAENLRLGRPDAGEPELRRALRLAEAEAFVDALPEGLATRLGRGGAKLSVGQRQRLAIARALVQDAPIWILDEPTSALDPETERRLITGLRAAATDRIVLVVTHRVALARLADEIVFLEDGRIVERGHPGDLLARPGSAWRRFAELEGGGGEGRP